MDKLLENISNWTVKTIGVMALLSSAYNGSPIGQAINPYFKSISTVQSVKVVTPKTKCKMIDGEKYCK